MGTTASDTGTFSAGLSISLSGLASYTGKYGMSFREFQGLTKKNALDAVGNCSRTIGLRAITIFLGAIPVAKFSAELLSSEHFCFVNAFVSSLQNY